MCARRRSGSPEAPQTSRLMDLRTAVVKHQNSCLLLTGLWRGREQSSKAQRILCTCDHKRALPRLGRIDDDRQVRQRGLDAALDCAGAGLEAPSRGTAQKAPAVETARSRRSGPQQSTCSDRAVTSMSTSNATSAHVSVHDEVVKAACNQGLMLPIGWTRMTVQGVTHQRSIVRAPFV